MFESHACIRVSIMKQVEKPFSSTAFLKSAFNLGFILTDKIALAREMFTFFGMCLVIGACLQVLCLIYCSKSFK
ncbi:hypothetical protein ES705_21140 [subsurface metagenome]